MVRLSAASPVIGTATAQSGYTGTSYLHALPDLDTLYQTGAITNSPVVSYPINFTNPGTYTLWLRGYAHNAAADSVHVSVAGQTVDLSGFASNTWSWANESMTTGITATIVVSTTGVYTLSLQMREDGLRVDRLLLTTDTTYIPTGFGPAETTRQAGSGKLDLLVDRVIDYDYDDLYRLTEATYTLSEASFPVGPHYEYEYDPVGNRLQQIINGDTTTYQYDATNRLQVVDGQTYTFDPNGNLKNTGVMTNTFDAVNRLISATRVSTTIQPIYNGVGDRIAQTVGATTTNFALDVQGLPEVIYASSGESYLHLPGVIMTEKAGQRRYLLPDGLGSIRQAISQTTQVVAYYEFDPYGNPVNNTTGGEPYGYTGEWYEGYMNLLHLRARWYQPETGTFLNRDPVESEPPYLYVRGNPVNRVDPSGLSGTPPLRRPDPYAFPEHCRNRSSKEDYVRCVAAYLGVKPTTEPPDVSDVKGSQKGCWYGSFPYIAPGYVEGRSGFFSLGISGKEIVYDFATMERQVFTYQGGGFGAENDLILAMGYVNYFAHAYGFSSDSSLANDYSGLATTLYFGISPSTALGPTALGVGVIQSVPMGGKVGATGLFIGFGMTLTPPNADNLPGNSTPSDTSGGPAMGASTVLYTAEGTSINYALGPSVDIDQLDIFIY